MPPTSALADLDYRLVHTRALRDALAAGDVVSAQRAYDLLPTWAWPASVAPALRDLRATSTATVDVPDRRGAA